LVCVAKVEAVLVLPVVSAVNVVLALKAVPASAGKDHKMVNNTTRIWLNWRTRPPKARSAVFAAS
jgi:hypothetical protein